MLKNAFINALLLVAALLSWVATAQSELKIMTDKSRVSGELRVYLQNISDKPISVLTENLSVLSSEGVYELSPERHVLIKDGKRIELKESLASYSLVELNPGETTYLKRFTITAEKGEVQYYVKPSWAKMHNVWGGRVATRF